MRAAIAAGLCLVHAQASSVATGTPVKKVIQMLSDMQAQGKQQKHEEQVTFAAYKQWCDDTSASKTAAIAKSEERIEALTADVQKAESDIAEISKVLHELEADVNKWTADKESTEAQRKKDRAVYDETHKDLSESVDALERAITVLKKQSFDRKQAEAALLQVQAQKAVPAPAKHAITAFLQKSPEAFLAAPEANAYEFQSGGVVDMLEKLKDEFEAEVDKTEKEELNSRHAAEMMIQDLGDQISAAEEERSEKTSEKSKREQALASAQGDLADTRASRDEDKKYLADLTSQCSQKSSEFEARQQLRAEEIEAIEKAVEILSSGQVAGAAQRQGMAQAFLQTGAVATNPQQRKVAAFLAARASKLGSKTLSMLAVKVGDDPFTSVKKLIRDMITRLLEEANEEATHKGWCDTEMGTNKLTREEKTAAMEKLTAEKEELTANISQLGEDISDLSKDIAELDAAVAKATEEREEEKKKNAATIKDAKEAQTAVAQALTVLKEFYARAGQATALVQASPAEDAPESWNEEYKGLQGESGGVVGMLEVIQSDFARLETETKSAEESASREYQQFMNDSETDKAVKNTDLEHKTNKRQQSESALASTKKDLQGTSDELDAANRYYEKLKPSCVDSGVTFEERQSRRAEEIESLKEALRILSGQDIA